MNLLSLEGRGYLVRFSLSLFWSETTQAILAAWASIHAPMGEKILAVADSNVAADNIYASRRSHPPCDQVHV